MKLSSFELLGSIFERKGLAKMTPLNKIPGNRIKSFFEVYHENSTWYVIFFRVMHYIIYKPGVFAYIASGYKTSLVRVNNFRKHCVYSVCKGILIICKRNLNYKKRLLLRWIHHFKSDWINNMDHMRISGTEPSSVILNQTK